MASARQKCSLAFFMVLSLIVPNPAFTEELPALPKGPLLFTSTTREQLSADYWIKRLPDPDKVIKTPEQLKKFNEEIPKMIKERVDVFKLNPQWPGSQIRDQIDLEYRALRGRKLFGVDDKYVPREFFEKNIKPVIQLDKIPSKIKMQWGVAVRATSVRALPTNVKMLEEVKDVEFDQLQFTLIKLWTPVGIYHSSNDGQWLYVQAPYTRGWVRAKDIAVFPSRDEVKKQVKSKDFIVVTGESCNIYDSTEMKKTMGHATMGTIIPLVEKTAGAYIVRMPKRGENGQVELKKGFIRLKSDVRTQFPSYTQRNIIRQAFKLLGARYGWGGMYGGRDCSGFTHDVFLSMGIDMPRDSKQQGYIGTQLNHFEPFVDKAEKAATLRSARGGLTILRTSKHVMLYLGEVNGNFFVIHSTWSERVSMTSDAKNRINQVVVTDLSLNGRSYAGSLFDRMVSVNEVD